MRSFIMVALAVVLWVALDKVEATLDSKISQYLEKEGL